MYRNLGSNPEVTLYRGTKEALTFADRWEHELRIDAPKEGDNSFLIKSVPANTPTFVRLLLRNDEGQFWSPESAVLPE